MVSNENTKEELEAPKTLFDLCDEYATLAGSLYDLTYYEEYLLFNDCMG